MSPTEQSRRHTHAVGRKIARFSGYVFLSSVLLQALSVVQSIIIIRVLGPNDFGLLSLVTYIVAVFGLVAGLGMPLGLVRLVSELRTRNPRRIPEIEVTFYWILSGSTLAVCIALLGLAPFLANKVYGQQRLATLLPLASAGLALSALTGGIGPLLQARQMIPTYAKLGIGIGLINFPFVVILGLYWGVFGVVIAGVVGGFASLLVVGVMFRGYVKRMAHQLFRFSRSAAKELIALGAPTVGANILAAFGMWAGVTILASTHGLVSLGVFGVANGVAGLILFVQGAVVLPFVPAATEAYAESLERLERTTLHTVRYVILIVFPICLFAALFSGEIASVLYGQEFSSARLPLGLMAAVALLLSYAGPVGYVYYALKLMKRMVILNCIWLCVLIGALLALVPTWAEGGLAFAFFIVFLLHLHVGLVLIRDRYNIGALYRVMLVTETLAVGLATLALLTSDWTLLLRAALFVSLVLAYVSVVHLRILTPGDKTFIKSLAERLFHGPSTKSLEPRGP